MNQPGNLSTMSRSLKNLAVVGSIFLVSCSGGSAAQDGESWNKADQKFVQEMIPHHEQAVTMSEMVNKTEVSSELADLASEIIKTQAAEIEQMQSFLNEWEVKSDPHSGHKMSGDESHGMMTDEDMDTLNNSSGAGFEKMWLTMMLAHHNGAVKMAETVIAEGKDSRVKTLAQNIIGAQQKEISLIKSLLVS